MTDIDWATLPYNEWPHTPPLEDFLTMEEGDPHLWWRLDSGHHLNLLDQATDMLGATPETRKVTARNAAVVDALTVDNRPRSWVQRKFSLSSEEVTQILRVYGLPLRTGQTLLSLDVYDAIENAIAEEWSLSEIYRTFKVQWNLMQRWFPAYRGWGPGASEQSVQTQALKRGLTK